MESFKGESSFSNDALLLLLTVPKRCLTVAERAIGTLTVLLLVYIPNITIATVTKAGESVASDRSTIALPQVALIDEALQIVVVLVTKTLQKRLPMFNRGSGVGMRTDRVVIVGDRLAMGGIFDVGRFIFSRHVWPACLDDSHNSGQGESFLHYFKLGTDSFY